MQGEKPAFIERREMQYCLNMGITMHILHSVVHINSEKNSCVKNIF